MQFKLTILLTLVINPQLIFSQTNFHERPITVQSVIERIDGATITKFSNGMEHTQLWNSGSITKFSNGVIVARQLHGSCREEYPNKTCMIQDKQDTVLFLSAGWTIKFQAHSSIRKIIDADNKIQQKLPCKQEKEYKNTLSFMQEKYIEEAFLEKYLHSSIYKIN